MDKPTIGVRYDIKISDCCVEEVSFIATLLHMEHKEWDDEYEYPTYIFDNGVKVMAQAIRFNEII